MVTLTDEQAAAVLEALTRADEAYRSAGHALGGLTRSHVSMRRLRMALDACLNINLVPEMETANEPAHQRRTRATKN